MYRLARSTAALNGISPKFEHRLARCCPGGRPALGREFQRQPQGARQLAQPLRCIPVRARLRRVGEHDQKQPSGQIVDHRQLLREQQQHVGAAERIGLEPTAREPRLDPAHRVVAEIAHQAAAQARQPGKLRDAVARKKLAHERQRIPTLGRFRHFIAVQHGDVTAYGAHRRAGREADERIAPETLAADHRFEQVGIRPVGKLEIDRQRRVEVGAGFEDDGNAVVALRGEPLEFCFSHLLLHENLPEIGIGCAPL